MVLAAGAEDPDADGDEQFVDVEDSVQNGQVSAPDSNGNNCT